VAVAGRPEADSASANLDSRKLPLKGKLSKSLAKGGLTCNSPGKWGALTDRLSNTIGAVDRMMAVTIDGRVAPAL